MNMSKYRESRRKQIGADIHDLGRKISIINMSWLFERTIETDKPMLTD